MPDPEALEAMHQHGPHCDGPLLDLGRKILRLRGSSRGPVPNARPPIATCRGPFAQLTHWQDVKNKERTITWLNNSFEDIELLSTIDPKKNWKGKYKGG